MAELVRRHRMLGASVGIFLIVLCCAATVIAEDGALEFAGKMYATDGNTLYFQARVYGCSASTHRSLANIATLTSGNGIADAGQFRNFGT